MSLSRGLCLLRQATRLSKTCGPITQQVRNSGGQFSYRSGAYPGPKSKMIVSEFLLATMWFWMIYKCVTEYDHIIGEFDYPDPKAWTNEELGIPPDDAD